MEDDEFLIPPTSSAIDESIALDSSSMEGASEIILSDKLRKYINGQGVYEHTRKKVLGLVDDRKEHVFRP
jgi:hypothetical protein